MDSMFQQLKKLYDSELYANVIPIVSERYTANVADVWYSALC